MRVVDIRGGVGRRGVMTVSSAGVMRGGLGAGAGAGAPVDGLRGGGCEKRWRTARGDPITGGPHHPPRLGRGRGGGGAVRRTHVTAAHRSRRRGERTDLATFSEETGGRAGGRIHWGVGWPLG